MWQHQVYKWTQDSTGRRWVLSPLCQSGIIILTMPELSTFIYWAYSAQPSLRQSRFVNQSIIAHQGFSSSSAEKTWPELINGRALLPCFSRRSTSSMLSSISFALLCLILILSSTGPSKPCTMITGIPFRCRKAKQEASLSNYGRKGDWNNNLIHGFGSWLHS